VSTTGKTTLLATARAIGAPDRFYVGIELRGVGGGLIYSHSTGWVTLTNSYQDITLTVTRDGVGESSWELVDSVTLVLGGDDAEFWAGNYGPKVDSASLKLDGTELMSNVEFVDGDRNWTSSVGWQTCSGGAGNAPCPTTGLFGATAPGAPTSVSGTSGNGQVSVSWTAPASNGGAVVTDYILQYSTSSDRAYATFGDGTATTTTATVTGLTNGTVYYFKVAAVNSVGTSSYSAVSSGVSPLGTRTLTISSGSYASSYRMAASPPTITSTASAGAGTKTYSSSTTSVCTINSSTGVVAFVSVGTCTIGASIAADSSYITASASAVSFSVVYQVGDTGPGGGKIFIIPSTTGNSTGKYFEAAPTSWNGGADPTVNWCNITNGAVGVSAQGTSIGSGQGNSTAISSYPCSSGAAVTARAYRGGGFSDWFLPSEGELKALQVVQATIGGFASATYWSSTEIASGRSGAFAGPTQEAYPVHFPDGGSNLWYKSQTYHVRPVRMFSAIS
jgi:hypothetical protein